MLPIYVGDDFEKTLANGKKCFSMHLHSSLFSYFLDNFILSCADITVFIHHPHYHNIIIQFKKKGDLFHVDDDNYDAMCFVIEFYGSKTIPASSLRELILTNNTWFGDGMYGFIIEEKCYPRVLLSTKTLSLFLLSGKHLSARVREDRLTKPIGYFAIKNTRSTIGLKRTLPIYNNFLELEFLNEF